jgi:hypothetical protein
LSEVYAVKFVCVWLLVAVSLLVSGCARPNRTAAEDLDLHISCETLSIRKGATPKIKVTVTNRGERVVTLVHPGDGSNSRMRTPIIGWSVLTANDAKAEHPKQVPLYRGGRCGNINALKPNEVFALKKNETKELGAWIGSSSFGQAGTYRVVFYYFNEPGLEWGAIPLGKHDNKAMQMVKNSTQCELISNELLIQVTP